VWWRMNQRGEAVLVRPEVEHPSAATLPPDTSVWTWKEHEDPFHSVAAASDQLGLSRGSILVDSRCWIEARHGLADALPEARLSDDRGVIASVRVIKSAQEVEAIAAACRCVGALYPEIARRIAAGVTEIGLAASAVAALPNGESMRTLPLLQTGSNASVPHRPTGYRPLADGDCVIVDYYVS